MTCVSGSGWNWADFIRLNAAVIKKRDFDVSSRSNHLGNRALIYPESRSQHGLGAVLIEIFIQRNLFHGISTVRYLPWIVAALLFMSNKILAPLFVI